MKYAVYVTYWATTRQEVEADSEEEAKIIGENMAGWPSLCHQCSRELEIGDSTGDVSVELIVYGVDEKVLYLSP